MGQKSKRIITLNQGSFDVPIKLTAKMKYKLSARGQATE